MKQKDIPLDKISEKTPGCTNTSKNKVLTRIMKYDNRSHNTFTQGDLFLTFAHYCFNVKGLVTRLIRTLFKIFKNVFPFPFSHISPLPPFVNDQYRQMKTNRKCGKCHGLLKNTLKVLVQ